MVKKDKHTERVPAGEADNKRNLKKTNNRRRG